MTYYVYTGIIKDIKKIFKQNIKVKDIFTMSITRYVPIRKTFKTNPCSFKKAKNRHHFEAIRDFWKKLKYRKCFFTMYKMLLAGQKRFVFY